MYWWPSERASRKESSRTFLAREGNRALGGPPARRCGIRPLARHRRSVPLTRARGPRDPLPPASARAARAPSRCSCAPTAAPRPVRRTTTSARALREPLEHPASKRSPGLITPRPKHRMPQRGERQADRVSRARSGRSRSRRRDDRARRGTPAGAAGAALARARPTGARQNASPTSCGTAIHLPEPRRPFGRTCRASALRSGPAPPSTAGRTVTRCAPIPVWSIRSLFEHLTRDAEEALGRSAITRAAQHLRDALTLWRGRPFGELADEGSLRLEAERLEEVRMHALELRIEADLALGREAELVDELERLVEVHPYRERLWQQLMLALYRAERQADALAAYARARTLLDEELGLEPGEELKRLEQAILRHEVPPAEPPAERHNLPAPVTSFVGRETELAEIDGLLERSAARHADRRRRSRQDAARPRGGGASAPGFPRRRLLLRPLHRSSSPAWCRGRWRGRSSSRKRASMRSTRYSFASCGGSELLLVLDNCEHLLDACAALVAAAPDVRPDLHVLATSREPLALDGETDYPVPPLSLPDEDATPDELLRSEAVTLFLARARAARPRLTEEDETVLNAARIARDLDGLPLALELAAARAKALSLEEIAGRLSDRFRFLVSWRRLSAARHRTLREAMDWSYELLGPDEQWLLGRLSVFAGGFTLAAVAKVCVEGDEERPSSSCCGSWTPRSSSPKSARARRAIAYWRRCASTRPSASRSEQADEVQRAHAEWCLQLAEEAEPELTGGRQAAWFDAPRTRARQPPRGARLSGDGGRAGAAAAPDRGSEPLLVRPRVPEGGRRWLDEARRQRASASPALRRRALTAAARSRCYRATTRRQPARGGDPRRRPASGRAALRRERAEQSRRDRPRGRRPGRAADAARGGGGARARGR